MYVIRNTMYAKPGKGGELIQKLKAAVPHFQAMGPTNVHVLTDAVATTWTMPSPGSTVTFSRSQPKV